jgi:hypothetical protein
MPGQQERVAASAGLLRRARGTDWWPNDRAAAPGWSTITATDEYFENPFLDADACATPSPWAFAPSESTRSASTRPGCRPPGRGFPVHHLIPQRGRGDQRESHESRVDRFRRTDHLVAPRRVSRAADGARAWVSTADRGLSYAPELPDDTATGSPSLTATPSDRRMRVSRPLRRYRHLRPATPNRRRSPGRYHGRGCSRSTAA